MGVDRERIHRDATRDARADATRKHPETARRKLLRTLETELRSLPAADRGPVACRAGCAFCCYLPVMATPVEVFGLLDYIEANFDADALAAFRAQVDDTAARVHTLGAEARVTTNVACPVLVDGNCSAYAARPFNCRSYHSLDRDACETSFNDPADTSRQHPQFSAVARVHEGVQGGLVAGLAAAGFDATQYELVTALAEALADPDARVRFDAGEPAFIKAFTLDQVG